MVDRSVSAADLASTVEAFCLIWLFYVQHLHSPTPLAIMSIYLTLDIAFKSTVFWAHCHHGSPVADYECLLVASLCIKTILFVLHEQSTWNNMKRRFRLQIGREATSGFWSRVFAIPLVSSLLRAQSWSSPQMEELDDTPISKELEVSFYDAWRQCKYDISLLYM